MKIRWEVTLICQYFAFASRRNYYVCEITNVPFIMAPPLVL